MTSILRRISALLLPDERKTSIRLVGSLLLNTLLDFLGLAALLPVLYYLLEGMDNSGAALLFCGIAFVAMVLKCVTSTFLTRFQNRFLLNLYKRLSFSLYTAYYNRGLLFVRQQGSNRLGYEVNIVCYAFGQNLLAPMAQLIGNVLLGILITAGILFVAPKIALLLFVAFLPFLWIYTQVISKRAKEYGKLEQQAKRKQHRLVAETFQGYSELKVNDAFTHFSTSFLEGADEIGRNRIKMSTMMRLPALLAELAIVVGLTILVLWGEGDLKLLIGIFALGAFKLLPAMRSILSNWTHIQNALCFLDVLEDGIKDKEFVPTPQKEITFQHVIEFAHVAYRYPQGETIFTDFNLTIRRGEQIGFAGYSGIGKSTLFNLLLGFLKPTGGAIAIDQTPLDEQTQAAWLKQVGFVSQEVYIFNTTLAENIALGMENIDRARVEEVLNAVSLGDWLATLPNGIDTLLGERGCELSGGQRQRVGIARALYKEIEVLLLDEATSALDDATEQEIMTTIDQLKQKYPTLTILSIAHRKSSLALCDRIINIEEIATL